MKIRHAIGHAVTFVSLCLLAHAAAADVWVKKVRNGTELVDAIVLANSSGNPAEIKLVAGTYHFNQSFDSDFGGSALPPITGTITIVGVGAATTILDAEDQFGRVATILSGGRLVLRNVTVTHGASLCSRCGFGGGGVANFGGSLQLDHCVVRGNIATGPEGEPSIGGGVESQSGSLRLDDTQVLANYAQGTGAGIAVVDGNVVINHSTIRGNFMYEAPGIIRGHNGGGLYIARATVVIDRSTISANHFFNADDGWVGFGAGILNYGHLTIRRSSITGNFMDGVGAGGGIFNGGTLTVSDSTIGGNAGGTLGGGVYNEGTLQLKGITIANNSILGLTADGFDAGRYPPGCGYLTQEERDKCVAGGGGIWNNNNSGATLRIAGSIATGNGDCAGTLLTQGHNIFGDATQCVVQRDPKLPSNWTVTDLTNVDPLLAPLHTSTEPGYIYYPLRSNSPAIDAGGQVNQNCNAVDQVGQARTDGTFDGLIRCDIGAVEFRVGK